MLLVLFQNLFALGFGRRLLFLENPLDRLLDVEVLDAGEFLQRVPVVQAVAAGENQCARHHEPDEHALVVDTPDKRNLAIGRFVLLSQVLIDCHEFVGLEACRHHAEVIVQRRHQ